MKAIIQYFYVVRAHFKAALLVALLVPGVALIGYDWVPKQYTADTTVMVDVRSPDPVAAVLLPATLIPGNVGTQVDVIKSDRVGRKVVKMLRLDENPQLKARWLEATEGKSKLDDWIATLLQRGLQITPSRESNMLNIAFRGNDPVFVATVANAYAQAYIEASIEMKVEPAMKYARWFGEQGKVMRENVEKAQARLSEYQREKGIVATEEGLDYELARLNELSGRLTAAQADTREFQSKQRSGSGAADVMPEMLQNPVIQGLRSDIVKLEIKLKEASGNLGAKHPEYRRMESELAELKVKLAAEENYVRSMFTRGLSTSTAVGKTKEAELIAAIAAQKKKVLDLKSQHDEIAVFVREVETAKRAYEAVTNRYNQTSLESQSTQTNVTVLSPAREPIEPSFPKPLRTTLILAIGLGIVLGVALTFGLEMLDPRVRSVSGLAELMQLPVLGVISKANRRSRLAFWSQSKALVVR